MLSLLYLSSSIRVFVLYRPVDNRNKSLGTKNPRKIPTSQNTWVSDTSPHGKLHGLLDLHTIDEIRNLGSSDKQVLTWGDEYADDYGDDVRKSANDEKMARWGDVYKHAAKFEV